MPTTPPSNAATTARQIADLWSAHSQRARAFVTRRAGAGANPEAIADALGSAAEILTASLAAGDEIRNPAGWLCTVAWREYLTILEPRGRELWRHDALEAGANRDGDELPRALTRRESAEQLQTALERAVGRLTPHQRAMVLGFYDGLSYEELAERNGVSWTSVSKALTRARAKLASDQDLRGAFAEWADD